MRRTTALALAALLSGAALVVPALADDQPSADTSSDVPTDGQPLCRVATPTTADATATHAARAPGEVRVATYNILHSQGDQRNHLGERIPLVVAELAGADADSVGLQEVVGPFDPVTGRSDAEGARHVAEQVAQGLADTFAEPWEWCWFQSNPHLPGEPDLAEGGGGGPATEGMVAFNPGNEGFREGVAILSRHDIIQARSRRMPPRSFEAPLCDPVAAATNPLGCPAESVFDTRQLLWANVEGPDGSYDLFSTHLAHGLTEGSQITKQLQVELMLDIIDEWEDPTTPTFFVGDFNSVEDPAANGEATDRRGTILAAGFVDTYRAFTDAPGFTSDQAIVTDTATPTVTARIDYVFARSPSSVAVTGSGVFGTGALPFAGRWLWPSDHLGVVSGVIAG
jgi:endonuclease/exonuclease/phosphatase family metal-dependent hydrolase